MGEQSDFFCPHSSEVSRETSAHEASVVFAPRITTSAEETSADAPPATGDPALTAMEGFRANWSPAASASNGHRWSDSKHQFVKLLRRSR